MTYELNFSGIADKQALHAYLAQRLQFPQWYGHNLDALMDCLTDLPATHIRIRNFPAEHWAEGFRRVFCLAAQENPDLQVTFLPKIYLFDFDGTLVDSMPTFVGCMLRILDENRIQYPADIVKILTPLGLQGCTDYFIRELGLDMEPAALAQLIKTYMYDAYAHTIPAKSHVIPTLQQLKSSGASLNILTASPHVTLDVCLQRLGMWELFDNIWSCDDFSTTKADPDIYRQVARRLETSVGDVLFLDDNLEACTVAKSAGMQVCGVYDDSSKEYAPQIKAVADRYIQDFSQLL